MKMRVKWRIAGVTCLATCLAMVVLSGSVLHPGMNQILLIGYWIVFTLLMMAALWIAMLDVRLTRLEYKLRERDLFHETFMTEEFRQVIDEAKKESGKRNDQQGKI